MSFELRMACTTDAGGRSENEDALVCNPSLGSSWLAVVADGAGGHAQGAEASRRVVARIEYELGNRHSIFQAKTVTAAVHAAHEDLLDGQHGTVRNRADAARSMHSTVVVLWGDLERGRLLWCHVGDSRLYRIRDGSCQLLTRDDSAIQSLVDAGLLTAEQARQHPKRSQLLAALGMEAPLEPTAIEHPVTAQNGDAYLLCSDGWWEGVTDDLMVDSLTRSTTPQAWLEAMRSVLDEQSSANQDNFSAVAAWIGDPTTTVLLIPTVSKE